MNSEYFGYLIKVRTRAVPGAGWVSGFEFKADGKTISNDKQIGPFARKFVASGEAVAAAREAVLLELKDKFVRLNTGAGEKITIPNPEPRFYKNKAQKWRWSIEWVADEQISVHKANSEVAFDTRKEAEQDFKNTDEGIKEICKISSRS